MNIPVDCIFVGGIVAIFAAVMIGTSAMIDRHLTGELGAIRSALQDIVQEMRRGRSPAE